MKRLKILYLLLLTIILICISSFIRHLYISGTQTLSKIADTTLRFSIETEFDQRFSELGEFLSLGPLKSGYKNIEFTHESGQTTLQVDSVNEEKVITPLTERKVRYTIASQFKECDLQYIDSLWQVQLANYGIEVKTALCLSHAMLTADTVSKKYHGKLPYNEKKKLDTYYAGIGNEIQIDAYVDYLFPVAIKNGNWNWFSFIHVFIIAGILLFLLYLYNLKRKRAVINNLPQNSADYLNEKAAADIYIYQLGNHVSFNPHTQMLITEKGESELRSQLCDILLLLLHAPGHYMKSKEILIKIWGNDTEIGINERLYKNISDLRKVLRKEDLSIQIKNESRGYRLCFKENC